MPDVSFTELPGRRVVLRRFRPEDVAEFVAYRSDPEVARYQSWDAPYPPEQGERFVAEMMTAHPDTQGNGSSSPWRCARPGSRSATARPCRAPMTPASAR
jgi:Acetyltransferase (GNAT) domain